MDNLASQVIAMQKAGLDALEKLNKGRWQKGADLLQKAHDKDGKVVISGLGKSGHIGKKMAATFASLGTPSFFLHATEALHGDLGMLHQQDALIVISNSGTTAEVVAVATFAKKHNIPTIAVTKNPKSPLAKNANLCLRLPDLPEADPNGLAPTTSTTATLVLGDVLAVLLSQSRGFGPKDFGRVHPGGALGQQAKGKP